MAFLNPTGQLQQLAQAAPDQSPQGNPFAWDTLMIGAQAFPGLALVHAKRRYRLDAKKQAGVDGGTLTAFGHEPGDVDIVVRVWTRSHFLTLPTALLWLLPKPNKGLPTAVDVSHPALAMLSIRHLFFTDVSAPEPTGTKQMFELKLKATEYLPAKPATKTVTIQGSLRITQVPVAAGTLPGQPTAPANYAQGKGVTDPASTPGDLAP